MHSHLLPKAWLEEIAHGAGSYGIDVVEDADGYEVRRLGARRFRILPDLSDAVGRLEALRGLGLDAQLVAPPTSLLLYGLERPHAQAVARLYNETVADVARSAGGRFIPAATVPMAWPDLAVAELDHAVNVLGLQMLFMATSVDGLELDGERFAPVFARAAELDVPVQLHPTQADTPARLQRDFLDNVLGNPFQTAIAAACLISGKVLDRNPNLRVLLVHGGGAFPYLSGRMQHGYAHVGAARSSARAPRDYLRRFFYDTLVHDAAALRFLADTVGTDRLVIGTDSPYGMGDVTPLDTLAAAGLAASESVRGGNAARLLAGT